MQDATALPEACTDTLERFLDPAIFRALADPTRLALLARLASTSGPLTVTELSSCCGVHLSGVSRHLKMLRDAALIQPERQGREVLYRLDCAALTATLRGMADALEQCQASCRAEGSPSESCCTTQKETHDDHASSG